MPAKREFSKHSRACALLLGDMVRFVLRSEFGMRSASLDDSIAKLVVAAKYRENRVIEELTECTILEKSPLELLGEPVGLQVWVGMVFSTFPQIDLR